MFCCSIESSLARNPSPTNRLNGREKSAVNKSFKSDSPVQTDTNLENQAYSYLLLMMRWVKQGCNYNVETAVWRYSTRHDSKPWERSQRVNTNRGLTSKPSIYFKGS